MIKGIIYCALSPSNKKYYGKTIRTIDRRKSNHLANSKKFNGVFYNAIKKYNIDKFIWKIIETYEFENKKDLNDKLNEREIYWIEKDKTYLREFGYNMTHGGDGGDFNTGRIFSKETREKQSKVRKGKKFSEEHKNNLSLSIKKIKDNATEQEKQKRHECVLGEKNGMYGKISPMRGKHVTEEVLNRIRINTKLAMQRPEVKQKQKENKPSMFGEKNGMFGKKHKDESRKKISINVKNTPKILCQHCLKEFYPWHYSRSHGNKCKNNK